MLFRSNLPPRGDFFSSTTELVPLPLCPDKTIFKGGTLGSDVELPAMLVLFEDVLAVVAPEELDFCLFSASSSSDWEVNKKGL